jgi:hypothetical protein
MYRFSAPAPENRLSGHFFNSGIGFGFCKI